MKNKFFRKVFLGLVLIVVLGVISAGCGTTFIPTTPTIPASCTLTVYSQCAACWGYVWVNGASTGNWILNNGAVTITGLTVGSTVSVQIVDNFGVGSHVEMLVLQPGNNILTFTWW